MSVFDINNPPSQPDSSLDADLSLEAACAVDGGTVSIAPGDWVDVNPSAINPDPIWGYSFQVSNMYSDSVGILILTDPMNDTYEESTLSFSWITNNFRKMPKT